MTGNILTELAECKHEHPETKILGKKKQYVATICKDCGLLLEFEEKRKVNA